MSGDETDEEQIEGGEIVKLIGSGSDDAHVGSTHSIFVIQNILEEILGLIEFNELCKCRLVCYFWNLTAAPILQNKRTLFFGDYGTFAGSQSSRKLLALRPLQKQHESYVWSQLTPNSKALPQLTHLLVNSKKLNLAEYFPYRKFQFSGHHPFMSPMINLSDEVLQSFLDTFGMYIDELSISFYVHYGNLIRLDGILYERDVMELIENLLVRQAPSLSFLSLETPLNVSWEVDGESRGKMSSLRMTDPEFRNIQKNLVGKRTSKLKFLHWTNQVSAKVLEVIFQLAPGLESVVLQTGYEHFLVEPLNRLHLLRYLDINPRYGCIKSLEALASSCQGGNHLHLRNIYIRYCPCSECGQYSHWTPDFQRRIFHVIHSVFAATQSSALKSVDWFGVLDLSLVAKIKFSNISPSICKIGRLGDPHYHHYPYKHSLVSRMFPFEFYSYP